MRDILKDEMKRCFGGGLGQSSRGCQKRRGCEARDYRLAQQVLHVYASPLDKSSPRAACISTCWIANSFYLSNDFRRRSHRDYQTRDKRA
jgi:hypothetical protein